MSDFVRALLWHATYPDPVSTAAGTGPLLLAGARLASELGPRPAGACAAAALMSQALVWWSTRVSGKTLRGWTVATMLLLGARGAHWQALASFSAASAALCWHIRAGGYLTAALARFLAAQLVLHGTVFACSAYIACELGLTP